MPRLLLPSNRKRPMSEEKRELLEKLKFELAFVEDSGYGRSVRTPHKPTSSFQNSLTCLNFGDPLRTHPCAACVSCNTSPSLAKAKMSLVTIFRSIRRAEPSPLWMLPRPKRSSRGGFAVKSTGLKQNSLFSRVLKQALGQRFLPSCAIC